MPETLVRSIWNFNLGTLIRKEELNGRQYIVVPMVMILEGVHVGSQGPVYYSLEELAKTPKQWNMKPIVIEHPFRGDTATDLEVYKKQAVGMIMNTHFVDGKLKAEAWIDELLAQEKCPELLEHIEHRLPMEISTGLFSELVMEPGTWNGEEYKGKIINIRADHLAILPAKQGACSLSDGAGLLINQSYADVEGDSGDSISTLNVISTVVNQNYPPGTNVVEDYDLDLETGKSKKKSADSDKDAENETKKSDKSDAKTKSKDKGSDKKEPIENAIKPEVFVTSDGNTITYKASGSDTLTIEKPDFSSGAADDKKSIDDILDQVKAMDIEPIMDNSIPVDVKEKFGKKQIVEMFSNIAEHIKQYKQNQQNSVFNENDVIVTNAEDDFKLGHNTLQSRARKLTLLSMQDSIARLSQELHRLDNILLNGFGMSLPRAKEFLEMYDSKYKKFIEDTAAKGVDATAISEDDFDEMCLLLERVLEQIDKTIAGLSEDSKELQSFSAGNNLSDIFGARKSTLRKINLDDVDNSPEAYINDTIKAIRAKTDEQVAAEEAAADKGKIVAVELPMILSEIGQLKAMLNFVVEEDKVRLQKIIDQLTYMLGIDQIDGRKYEPDLDPEFGKVAGKGRPPKYSLV